MRFLRRRGTSTPPPYDLAEVNVNSIRIELTGESSPIVRAHFRLHAREASDRRKLLVDFSGCPLLPLEIDGEVVEPVNISGEETPDAVFLNLRQDSRSGWDESELTVVMRWSESVARPPLVDEMFLYAPEELPTIGGRAGRAVPMARCIPLSVEGEIDQFLVGAVSSTLDGRFHRAGPQVQAVFSSVPRIRCSEEEIDPIEICLLTESRDAQTKEAKQSIRSQIREMSNYFGEQLGVYPGLRIAVALDSSENSRSMFGALLTAPAGWYRFPAPERQGKEFQIARMVANIWWGAGCRVSGAEGLYLASGIAFALGLAWVQSHASATYFDAQISYFRERLVPAFSPEWAEPSPGERSIPIGIAIFDGLIARESVRNSLGQLTRKYWGCEAPAEVVVSTLESAGVNVADFERKRFRR